MVSCRVLIVDDQNDFRKTLIDFVNKQEGFEVIAQAKDGDEAIAMTKIHIPDLILMDISMPRFSGIDAAKAIKEFSPQTKIVFITIHEERIYQAMAHLLNVDGYVCKSSLKEDLPKALQKMKEYE